MAEHGTAEATEVFFAHRRLLFTIAYEMLGSATDADDVLQETWLRWIDVDLAQVRDQRAYLVRITTRQALNRLRTLMRRREDYVGPWLPEPLLTTPDVADDIVLVESVSIALMLVLETLTPTERAVFVLREVFEVDYGEIAQAVGKSSAAVRQIAHRARKHVQAGRPPTQTPPDQARTALVAFRQALENGDLQGLLDVLAPDVVLLADGGGLKTAARRPIRGVDKVARYLTGGIGKAAGALTVELTEVNGGPAFLFRLDGMIDGLFTGQVQDGRITGLYYVRNPHKLSHVDSRISLTLH